MAALKGGAIRRIEDRDAEREEDPGNEDEAAET